MKMNKEKWIEREIPIETAQVRSTVITQAQ